MKKTLQLFTLFMLTTLFSYAQQNITITGKVTNKQKESLGKATITVNPSGKSITTDDNGNYSLTLPSTEGKITLRVSYSGYETAEQVIEGNSSRSLEFVLKSDVLNLTEVVLVGSSSPKSKLNSSVSVSTLKLDDLNKTAARTTSEILRSIPGIKAEASGGDGNTNITVRGVPISAGGSKYLQLQEDGLPVLQFGDIAFATADIFLRADNTLAKIEAIRGGSASTLASNSPAGIINFISKTGSTEGGSISFTQGIGFGNSRTDFNYGSPIGNGLSFNVGGFYRSGEGPRTAGFNANNGGQMKMNLTKQFSKGYARLYFKYLNDRAAAYMPMPLQVTGTNENPTYTSLNGFDAKNGTLHSPFMTQNFGIGVNGERRNVDVSDGMHPVSTSVGAEFSFDLGDGWRLEDRARLSLNSGRFVAPFPASVGTRGDMLSAIAGAKNWNLTGASLRYSNDNANYTGTNAMIIHMFDTELTDFNNFLNDFKLKKKLEKVDLTFGFYKSLQNINMSWLWNSYLTDVKGDGLRPLDIYNNTGVKLTENGQFAYGVPVWGNCCQRGYNVKYEVAAPYAVIGFQPTNELSLEASMRWDIGSAKGNFAGSSQSAIDVNNNGRIDSIETSVSSINRQNISPVNYNYNYVSFSFGGNYKLTESTALFARYSSGYSAKADRILFSGNVLTNGEAKGVTDKIDQAEIGYKANYKNLGLFITGFYANVNEQGGYEATTQRVIENKYQSVGLEIEAAARIGKNFDIRGGITYTSAKITSEGATKNNQPRRQAPFIFNIVPTFTANDFSIGFTAIGTSSSYAQDDNKLKLNGYVMINPFINYKFSKSANFSINANNIGNVLGITESEEGAITPNTTNIIRARSIMGTTISATATFNF
ncbi:MAG: TonB-dependent receptor [Chitinophagaceae bacterium]